MLLALTLPLVLAELPLPTYPQCGEPDRPELCPEDLGQDWALLGHVPAAWQAELRPEELALGSGIGADLAWRTTTGRTDVVIAVMDSGILWDDPDVLRKHALSRGELPRPLGATGEEAADWDANGDGVFNIDDYADDARVDPTAGVGGSPDLDPSDLIAAFSDGLDDDDNGFVDDISGWDFLWNDNNPYDDTRYDHGTYEAEEIAKEGGDGRGGIGVCPNCMILSLRVGDSFVADGAHFAAAMLYAAQSEAAVASEALGTLTHPEAASAAIDLAWDQGLLLVASAADETSWHQNSPGWVARTLYVHAIVPDDDIGENTTFLAYSNCTNHGARLELSASSGGCSSGATGITAGVAGLVVSAARDVGVELGAGELKALLTTTAQDIAVAESLEQGSRYYPTRPGWDRFSGYGRVDAHAAVAAVVEGRIPPVADLRDPGWFVTLSPERAGTVSVTGSVSARAGVDRWVLEWGAGDEPTEWAVVGEGSGPADGALAEWDLRAIPAEVLDPQVAVRPFTIEDELVSREDAVNVFTATLRLRVTDAAGVSAEDRRAVYIHHDPDWLPAFPMFLGGSLESSPKLADLDGDGVLDIVQGSADGRVYALRGDGTALPGWPVELPLTEEFDPTHPNNHLEAPAFAALGAPMRQAVMGTPAVGDLDGDGALEVVAATLQGALVVFNADGTVRPGFPVQHGQVEATGPTVVLDEGFFSSPALVDLDGDGGLDIVVGGMDQRLYAVDGQGQALPGFPVRLVWPELPDLYARIVSSPAVGDVDGDGHPEIAIGTNEALNEYNGAIYLVGHDGVLKPGWPVATFGAFTQALPYVGEGVPTSPALADLDGDGDLEICAFTQAGDYELYDHDGTVRMTLARALDRYGAQSNVPDGASFPLINNPSFGDLNGDGRPELVSGGTGSDYAVGLNFDGKRWPFSHTLNAWDVATGDYLPAFPRMMEDMQFFANPAIADLDGDRAPEVITGTGGFLVHAVNAQGRSPAGWPRFTGQWNLASPAVGDVDGDGDLDVVTGTRGGWLYVWGTPSPAGAQVSWAGFGHDAQNTRNHETPLPGYNAGYPEEEPDRRCGCASGGAHGAGAWVALAALLARRRASTRVG